MNFTLESTVLRRRRTVEAGSLVSRGGGVVCTVLFLTGAIGMPAGLEDAPAIRMACLGGLALMAVGMVLGALNLRRPGGRHYDLISTLLVGADTLSIAVIVAGIQATGQTTWPVLVLAILTAALRKQVTGALAAWVVTSGVLALIGAALPPGTLATAVLLHLLVAMLAGTQARAYGRQVAELDAARRQLQHQATHDALTGLPNRQHLQTHAEALTGEALAVLLLDLDGFKAVNDTQGHAAGDELLRVVADRLRASLRDTDLAARIGGDEFLVVLAGARANEANALATRLREAVRHPIDLGATPVTVGVSIGVATRPAGDTTSLESLSLLADAGMYREKAYSRSRTGI
jgi:diguanylate cyclase (GGDEF)-like protein